MEGRIGLITLLLLQACAAENQKPSNTDPGTSDGTDTADTEDTGDTADTGDTGTTTELYGPNNAWYHANAADVTVPTDGAWGEGKSVPDLQLIDQNGDKVSLYQFTGRTVFIDFFAGWCGPCNAVAPTVEAFWEAHKEEAVVLEIELENNDFDPGDADAVAEWVATYGNTSPVTWIPKKSMSDAPEIYSFPTFMVLDTQMRVANGNVFQSFGDAYYSQMFDRMAFMIGGNLDDAEVCDDGIDNDLNGLADCMDDACGSSCDVQNVTGQVVGCAPDQTAMTTIRDIYRVVVPKGVVSFRADTVSAETGFDVVASYIPEGGDWANESIIGDDEVACTWPVEDTGCVNGWLRPGTYLVAIRVGTGGSDYDGDCADPALGEYVLHIAGEASLELVEDDVPGVF